MLYAGFIMCKVFTLTNFQFTDDVMM